MRKHLTFPLDVLGLHLSPGGVPGTPQLCLLSRQPRGHAGSECQGGGRITGDLPGGRLPGPALEPVPQPRSELAERSEAGQSCASWEGRLTLATCRISARDAAMAILTLTQVNSASSRR